jgi:very-short-patch-repair endonuclease
MSRLKTKEGFIADAIKIHGSKYDYSKVEYINNKTKVCIICPKHGEFWQKPNAHLNGNGCKECYNESRGDKIRKNTEYFIKKAKEVHGDKYDYSKVEYIDARTKVCIICPVHGEFWQTPNTHLNGRGCKECGKIIQSEKKKDTLKSFIEKARMVHGDKYDYSKVEYIDSQTKVCIICPIHGEFWQKPNAHLNGNGCNKCLKTKKLSTEEFIEKARAIHGNKYDYSKTIYKNAHTKVCIICPIHGEFWQIAADHINAKCGCPACKESHLESDTRNYLNSHKISFNQQQKFNWLGLMRLDFYIPRYNIAIECQGIQHFEPIDFGGKGKNFTKKMFKELVERDKLKKELCEEHGVKIIYINYNENVSEQLNKKLNTF